MAKTTKTLQVSFGRFACTLEGYEDPVEAMKVVLDYLRDLSARDPDFAARLLGPISEAGPARGRPASSGAAPEGPVLVLTPPLDLVSSGMGPPSGTGPAGAAPSDGGMEGESAENREGRTYDPNLTGHPGLQKLLTVTPDNVEEELSRFLSQADDKLADPEAARRRDVIAQLKAAVAATEAERALGDSEPAPGARDGAFRSDLKDVVRSSSPAPDEPAPPLRLAASQRVDLVPSDAGGEDREDEEPSPGSRSGRARPRDESFAAFAAEVGADSLNDVLEAAAAWLCFVGDVESVSRSQLLALAAEAMPEPPDREEGLRAFGVLLRQGRIAPVAGGRYRINSGSRFDPGRLAG